MGAFEFNMLFVNGGERLKRVRHRSAAPVYGIVAVWVLYGLFFPLYRAVHLIIPVLLSAAAYIALSRVFPGVTEIIEAPEEPVSTGDKDTDALLKEGKTAVSEMKRIHDAIGELNMREKLAALIEITDKIFKDVLEDPSDYRQIRRFADYYLPTTMKLLHSYERFSGSGGQGEHVSGTMARIESALDSIIDSYKRQFDALFYNQALDIETDISVLETMLKKEGLGGRDFG
jgi:5-bromo-4-chloroindolyl phosphate hydrolysis protein